MKKTILSFLCIGCTGMLIAQQPHPNTHQATPNTQSINNQIPPAKPANTNTNNNNNNNTVSPAPVTNENNTIGNTPPDNNHNTGMPLNNNTTTATYSVTVPTSVETSFKAAYPMASTVTWRQSGDWYSARYKDEHGKLMEVAYREDGKTFTRAASPLLRTYVPEEAVNKAVEMYGANIYAIALVKGSEGDMYNVTVIENGQSKTLWMNADGSTVMNPYRTEEAEQSADVNTTQPANTTEATEPQAAPADNSNSPEEGTIHDHDQMMREEMEDQQPVMQEDEPVEVDESTRLNREGINNGKGSDDVMPEEEYVY
ncbi:MAG TPA: hypothetical protein VD993_08685 [Chitinophagaceae bacterium]|nr:hypothetical protein [Chitinophagaceae bacterium]